jgi:hypothetical protein
MLPLVVLIILTVIGVGLGLWQNELAGKYGVVELETPVVHEPPYLGNYSFIVGSGTLLQNGSAYSYVRINASALQSGQNFLALPALNIGLVGKGVNEHNFTIDVTYTGSVFPSSPYWINFSLAIPELQARYNTSQMGVAATFNRSSFSIPDLNGAQLFAQVSSVVGEYNEFEYFYYIGNSSTPVPVLAHGPVH